MMISVAGDPAGDPRFEQGQVPEVGVEVAEPAVGSAGGLQGAVGKPGSDSRPRQRRI